MWKDWTLATQMPRGEKATDTMPQLQEVRPLGKRLPGGLKGPLVRSPKNQGLELKRPKAPLAHRIATEGTEPRATLNMTGRTINLLLDTGAAYSILNFLQCSLSLSLSNPAK